MFYVMCSTYCVCMFLCSLYAPMHQNKFQVGVNLLGNKYYSDSDSDADSEGPHGWVKHLRVGCSGWEKHDWCMREGCLCT